MENKNIKTLKFLKQRCEGDERNRQDKMRKVSGSGSISVSVTYLWNPMSYSFLNSLNIVFHSTFVTLGNAIFLF